MERVWRKVEDIALILTLKLDTDTVGDALDTARPDRLVELRVETYISRTHRFLCKLNDALHCPWCTLLEAAAVHELVQMYGVFARDDVSERGALGRLKVECR